MRKNFLRCVTFVIILSFLQQDVSFCIAPGSPLALKSAVLLRQTLESSINKTISNQTAEYDPVFNDFLDRYDDERVQGFFELSILEVMIFMGKWHAGEIPSIQEQDLKDIIEGIFNKWMRFYKNTSLEAMKQAGKTVTKNYSVWGNACKVKQIILKGDNCYLSVDVLNFHIVSNFKMDKQKNIEDVENAFDPKTDQLLGNTAFSDIAVKRLNDLKGKMTLKGALSDIEFRQCIQEIIDNRGWDLMAQDLFTGRETLEAGEEEITGFLRTAREEMINDLRGFTSSGKEWEEWRREHDNALYIDSRVLADILRGEENPERYLSLRQGEYMFKGSYPTAAVKTGSADTPLPLQPTDYMDTKLAQEVISALTDIGKKVPKVNETLINSLVERIQKGRVFFGKNFLKGAVAAEMQGEKGREYCIFINHHLQSGLYADTTRNAGKTLRGIFLASLLLGQEAQIYMREKKNADWDDPEYNSAFIAQAAEFQVINAYRNEESFFVQYFLFMNSLQNNIWGEVNITDSVHLQADAVKGMDANFLEAKIDTLLYYRDILASLSNLRYSKKRMEEVDIKKVYALLQEMGLGPLFKFRDIIPPAKRDMVKVEFINGADAKKVMGEEELKKCVRNTYFPIYPAQEPQMLKIEYFITRETFGEIIIAVDPRAKRVKARIDFNARTLVVTVPEIADQKEWQKYCGIYRLTEESEAPVIETDTHKEYLNRVGENQKTIKEVQAYFQRKDYKNAFRILNTAVIKNPHSFELIEQLVRLLMFTGSNEMALENIHIVLSDSLLYLNSQKRLLFSFLHMGIQITSQLNKPGSTGEAVYLANIAKQEMGRYIAEIDSEAERINEEINDLRGGARDILSEVGMSGPRDFLTPASGLPASNYSLHEAGPLPDFKTPESPLERHVKFLRELKNDIREEKVKVNNIFASISRDVFSKSFMYLQGMEWKGEYNEDSFMEGADMISKMWISFAGGDEFTDIDIEKIFNIFKKRQGENPLNFHSLFVWGYCLFQLWKNKFPERKEYLKEAEKRFEQYVSMYQINSAEDALVYYYLGLIKYYLGDTEGALTYLDRFFENLPYLNRPRYDFIEGINIHAGLKKEQPAEDSFEIVSRIIVGEASIRDFLDNFMEPFIKGAGFTSEKVEKKSLCMSTYLDLLKQSGRTEKAYRQAKEWCETLPSVNVDLVKQFVEFGVTVDKNDEVRETLQKRFADTKLRDFLLEFVQVIVLMNSKELPASLKMLNSLIQKYSGKIAELEEKERMDLVANLSVLRADVYRNLGRFKKAIENWVYLKDRGLRSEGHCMQEIRSLCRLDEYCSEQGRTVLDKLKNHIYDPKRALEKINEILDAFPHHVEALNIKYSISHAIGNTDIVLSECLSLLELYPDAADLLSMIASLYVSKKDPKAFEYFKRYIDTGGKIEKVRRGYALAYFNAEKWEEAIEHLSIYIKSLPDTENGRKEFPADIYFALIASYIKIGQTDKASFLLVKHFSNVKLQDTDKKLRMSIIELCLMCCSYLLGQDKPNWKMIDVISGTIEAMSTGLNMNDTVLRVKDDIEYRKMEIEEANGNGNGSGGTNGKQGNGDTRGNKLKIKIKRIRNLMNKIINEVMDFEILGKIADEVTDLISSAVKEAEALQDTDRWHEAEGFRESLEGNIRIAGARIIKRNEDISAFMARIVKITEDLLGEKDAGEAEINMQYDEAKRLGVSEREDVSKLLKDLKAAKEIIDEKIRQEIKRERIKRLQQLFADTKKEVEVLIKQLEDLHPKQDPDPILTEYRGIITGFLGAKDLRDLRKSVEAKDWPEEFKDEVIKLDNRIMGRYGQAKGRKKLEARDAFETEIRDAFLETETVPMPHNGSSAGLYEKAKEELIKPIERVLEKYERIQGFKIKYTRRREILRRADEKILVLAGEAIKRAEEEKFAKEQEEARVRDEREQELIMAFFARREAGERPKQVLTEREQNIEDAIHEWSEIIRKEIREIKESNEMKMKDIDLDDILQEGRRIANRLEEAGVFLTYEEALYIRGRIFGVFNPDPENLKIAWSRIDHVLHAFRMSKEDRPRAKKEVDDCFKRPAINEIDEKIYSILTSGDIPQRIRVFMEDPAPSVKKLIDKDAKLPEAPAERFMTYWKAANESGEDSKYWWVRTGRTSELIQLGIIKDPDEVIKLQIRLLREIYTEDPDNRLDPKSPSYAEDIACAIARVFSGKKYNGEDITEKQEFLYNLKTARLKLVPREMPAGETDEELSWIARTLGTHRELTPDETKALILLAQRGNPLAMNVLKLAHVITVLTIAKNYIKKEQKGRYVKYHEHLKEYVQNGYSGFSKAVLHYGYSSSVRGRQDKYFGLYLIKATFLTFAQNPVFNAIARQERRHQTVIDEATWISEHQMPVKKARAKIYRDIDRLRPIIELLQAEELTPELLKKISLSTGFGPLLLLSRISGNKLNTLEKQALKKIKGKFKKKNDETLKLLARSLGMTPMEELIKGLDRGKAIQALDEAFTEIVSENKDLSRIKDRENYAKTAVGILGVDLTPETVSEIEWIEKRKGHDLKDKDLAEVYLGYIQKIIELIQGEPDPKNNDIADIVEYMTLVSLDRQRHLDSIGIRGIKDIDAPVGGQEDSDTELGELESFAEETGTEAVDEEVIAEETPDASGIKSMSMRKFMKLREKVIKMLDKLGEKMIGRQKLEIEEIRPEWEKRFAELESRRRQVKEIEDKLSETRAEKLKDLDPIAQRKNDIEKRHRDENDALIQRQKIEKTDLTDRHAEELKGQGKKTRLKEKEKRRKRKELAERVNKAVDIRKYAIEKEHERKKGEIEERANRLLISEDMRHSENLSALQQEISKLKARQVSEIHALTFGRNSGPKEMSRLYPDMHEGLPEEQKGTVPFIEEFWKLLLDAVSYMDLEKIKNELKSIVEGAKDSIILNESEKIALGREDAEAYLSILNQLIDKNREYNLDTISSVCTVFTFLSFDKRLWDLIDSNSDLDLRGVNGRLNAVIRGLSPDFSGFYENDYGITEAQIFSKQVVILMKIAEKYKRYLRHQAENSPRSALDELRELHQRQIEEKEGEVKEKTLVENEGHEQELRRLETEKEETLKTEDEEFPKRLADLENKRRIALTKKEKQFREWEQMAAAERVIADHKREKDRLLRRHKTEIAELEQRYIEELSPVDAEYASALAEVEARMGAELRELEEALTDVGKGLTPEEVTRIKHTLFTSEKCLADWLAEERTSLKQMEEDFEPLNIRFRQLEGAAENWERKKYMFLDKMGLSDAALESDTPLTMMQIAELHNRPGETPITRERVRQILQSIQLQILLFSDLDDFILDEIHFFTGPRNIELNKLLIRLKLKPLYEIKKAEVKTEAPDVKADDLWTFTLSRKELFQLIRTVLAAQEEDTEVDPVVSDTCLTVIRLFIAKNQAREDTYKIASELARELIEDLELGEDILLRFEEKIGNMRIKLLREKQMGSSDNSLKPYNKTGLSQMEKRFSDDYVPEEEYEYFPSNDKNWLSRDEIISLGLTWCYYPDLRDRMLAVLNKFVEEQDERYPDSGILGIVTEVVGEARRIYREKNQGNAPDAGFLKNEKLENTVNEIAKDTERVGFIQIDSALLNNSSSEFLDSLYLYLEKINKENRIAVEVLDRDKLSINKPELIALLNSLSKKAQEDKRFEGLVKDKDNTFILAADGFSSARSGNINASLIKFATEESGNYYMINAMTIARGVIFAGGTENVSQLFLEAVQNFYSSIFENAENFRTMGLAKILNIVLPPIAKAEWEIYNSICNGIDSVSYSA